MKNFSSFLLKLILISIVGVFLSSCFSGETSEGYIKILEFKVEPDQINRSDTTEEITLFWKVDFVSSTGNYDANLYVSCDQTIDENDIVFPLGTYSRESVYLEDLPEKDKILQTMKYACNSTYIYLILQAKIQSEDGQDIVDTFVKPISITGSFNQKKWTFMVYMDADNDLDEYADLDLEEMKSVGSTDEVNIVVLVDKYWESPYAYFVQKGDLIPWKAFEEDVSNSSVLVNFVSSAISRYPAQHYALILWNHGGGFKRKSTRDLLIDFHPFSKMDILSLKNALLTIKNSVLNGKKINILGFDACLMGMTEIAYELKDTAEIMIASEDVEPGEGWPYDKILNELTTYPEMDDKTLASLIISNYNSTNGTTLSAINLNYMDELKNNATNLVTALVNILNGTDNDTKEKLLNLQVFRFESEPDFIDLFNATAILISSNLSDNCTSAAENLWKLKDKLVLYNYAGDENIYGLSLWLPTDYLDYLSYKEHYEALSFCNETGWGKFIEKFIEALTGGSSSS